jgi:hypothetical protein
MEADMTTGSLMQRSAQSPMASLREKSSSTLRAAIRSPNDPGRTLRRVTAVLATYFDPDHDPAVKAAVREEFVRALAAYPDWAVQRAFDSWVKTAQRRPTPGDIVILVGREIKPLTDELLARKKLQEERADYRTSPSKEEIEQRKAFAEETLRSFGFAIAHRTTGSPREGVSVGEIAEMRSHIASKGMV